MLPKMQFFDSKFNVTFYSSVIGLSVLGLVCIMAMDFKIVKIWTKILKPPILKSGISYTQNQTSRKEEAGNEKQAAFGNFSGE
jgi:hypothetical protein